MLIDVLIIAEDGTQTLVQREVEENPEQPEQTEE